MPFKRWMPALAWKDPLTWQRVRELYANHDHLLSLTNVEHDANGRHNAQRIARGVGIAQYAAGSYSLINTSSSITAVTRNGVGDFTLTLDAASFEPSGMAIRVSPIGGNGTAPLIAHGEILTSTSARVRIYANTAGTNTWTASDTDCAFAIHSNPPAAVAPSTTALVYPSRGYNWSESNFNALAMNTGVLRHHLTREHEGGGRHNAREVARAAGQMVWDGSAYSITTDIEGTMYDPFIVGTGHLRIAILADLVVPPMAVFIAPDYARGVGGSAADLFVINAPAVEHDAEEVVVYIWKYDFGTDLWAAADCGFGIAVHGDPLD